jgi:hypothetical protein
MAASEEFRKLEVTTTMRTKRTRGKRRELAPLELVDAIDALAMKALPTSRHRAFVRALYAVKPGHCANVKAAKSAKRIPPSCAGTPRAGCTARSNNTKRSETRRSMQSA